MNHRKGARYGKTKTMVSYVVGTLGNLNKGPSVLQGQEERAGAEAEVLGSGANMGKWREEREAFTGSLRVVPHRCHLEPLDRVSPIKKQGSSSSNCHQSPRLEQMERTSWEYGGQAQWPHTASTSTRQL